MSGGDVVSDLAFSPCVWDSARIDLYSWVWDAWASHACACTLMISPKQDTLRVRTEMNSQSDSVDCHKD